MGYVYNPYTGDLEDDGLGDSSDFSGYGNLSGSELADLGNTTYGNEVDSGMVDFSGYANLTGPQLTALATEVANNQAFSGLNSSSIAGLVKSLVSNPKQLATIVGGLAAANKSGATAPTGYQGKIPAYTATRTMQTAPPAGRRPGSVGINYGGDVAYKTPQAAAAEAAKPVEGLARGGLASNGFVVPADVVSHLGNGSSEAGLRLLAENFNATPIKGAGDGMSDSIPTKIDGKQEARVANEEAFISPATVKQIGGGDVEKGSKKLYAMMDQIRQDRTGTKEQGKEINPSNYMPGGSVSKYATGGTTLPTGATGSESSLSNWAGPYVTEMLGKGQALAEAPYQAYTGPLTAGASGLQQQAFTQASGMQAPSSIGQAATTAGGIASLAPEAGKYTAVGSQFGTQQAQQYMNPYMETALRPQLAEMQRASDIARLDDASRLTKAGAYGGSRQAIMESEARRNLLGKQSDVLGMGYATAYDKAAQQFNADQARKIQEQQFGTTTGLQGLQTGLQAAQAQGQLGTQEGQLNLQGLQQLASLGATERGIESEGIAADKAQFEEARLNPYKMLQFQQSLLSGMPLASQSYSMPQQSNLQQFASGATTVNQLLDILSGKTAATTKT